MYKQTIQCINAGYSHGRKELCYDRISSDLNKISPFLLYLVATLFDVLD